MARMRLCSLLTAAWLAAAGAPTASGADLPQTVRDCANEKDDARRLACFDHAVAELRGAPQQDFGVDPERARRERERIRASAHEMLTSKVTQIAQRPHGELVISLDNGQEWLQLESMSYFPLKPGDTITLSHGFSGSFFLANPDGLATRVKRTR